MTRIEFDNQYRINWDLVNEQAAMHNVSRTEALDQILLDAWHEYKDSILNEQ